MKKFRFKFEAVLEMRKKREEEALRNLAASQRVLRDENERKNFLESELQKTIERIGGLGKSAVPVTAFQAEDDYIVGTKQRIAQSQQAIFRINKTVEKSMRAFLVAKKQRKTMEMLYEKSYEKYREEIAKKEEKEQDDLMVMRLRLQEESI